ncbi:MAG: transcriptional repressor [Treponema sp.]|nr:transcriptional repressor [Treponema sp.]MBQ2552612.1 transcriptional repressor [Treponema sp.]MBQ4235549.1 transcriptional repressor [Treponema sp.]
MAQEQTKISYRTKQRDFLLDFAKSTSGSHFTVEDIKEYCASKNICVGTATIYRSLEKMTNEHIINKYFVDEKSAACFEYIGEDDCSTGNHFHLKCEKCGKLIHLECSDLEIIKKHLLKNHGFSLDSFKTVFYGICKECQKNEKKH